ncbi:hypothetical protein H3N56_03390 [Cetobacterium sp. 2A]|uniref:hypothetical protein n=1 Tax=Cetobacterium sp. 2A TaxID=2754723 RepID=UPI00163D13D5|nr:hypothetical protein [Cetobacterium sp. 2A]MBC2855539.1 hypothetical protein [Cetobacterium sp. 2A]
MKRFLLTFIFIFGFFSKSFSTQTEICVNGVCELEGVEIPVRLVVPKVLSLEYKDDENIDFGNVVMGENAITHKKFIVKGFGNKEISIATYVNQEKTNIIPLKNENNPSDKIDIEITQIKEVSKSISDDSAIVEITLNLDGKDTVDKSSGIYNGTFYVRATLN